MITLTLLQYEILVKRLYGREVDKLAPREGYAKWLLRDLVLIPRMGFQQTPYM